MGKAGVSEGECPTRDEEIILKKIASGGYYPQSPEEERMIVRLLADLNAHSVYCGDCQLVYPYLRETALF